MDVGRSVTELYKIWLAGGAVLLALAWGVIPRKWALQGLVALTALAVMNYARWGFEAATSRLDAYDLLHYYVNAKYIDELGYLDLYPAVLLVDHEHQGPFFREQGSVYLAQDERGHHLEPIGHALARGRVVRDERFTDERWAAFEHDVLYLQRVIGCRDRSSKGRCVRELDENLWRQLINDHGFNGTTAWTLLAEPITQVVPVESLKVIGYLDVVLLGGALALVVWAYGAVPALWLTLFLTVTYSTRWPYFSWVFLRYDWVAALVAATALLKLGRPFPAGLLAGWATLSRFFPAMYLWGPFCKGVALLARGVVSKPLLTFAGAVVLAVVLVQGAATARYGAATVRSHFENMMDHNEPEQLSSRRIGLALALATEPWEGTAAERVITAERKERIERQSPARYLIGLAAMLGLGWVLRARRDDEAFAYGFLPFFLLTTASYYYYVARAPLIVVHAAGMDRWRDRVGLAYLLALEVFCNAAETYAPGHRLFLIGDLAWGLAGYTALMIGWMAWDARAARTEEAT